MTQPMYVKATAPSNIAFIKYWGKLDEKRQWPANSSLSMSLSKLASETYACPIDCETSTVELNGSKLGPEDSAQKKIVKHLEFLARQFPDRSFPSLHISSKNTFPTGCGIASSASGFAALTLAALGVYFEASSLEELCEKSNLSIEAIAHLARQGSGSAGRSLWGGFVSWDKADAADRQTLFQSFSSDHWSLCDSVVLFSSEQKKVGSTEAHRLAWSSPLFAPRLAIVEQRLGWLNEAIESRDIDALGRLIEEDCLEMHAVIMSATPPVHYFASETSEFLSWIRNLRKSEHIPVYFTIDAGANVHLIYEKKWQKTLLEHLDKKLGKDRILSDEVGRGPSLCRVSEKGA